MKNLSWGLFVLSVVALVLGVLTRFTPQSMFGGVSAGTFWKASIALLGYAATLRLFALADRRPA